MRYRKKTAALISISALPTVVTSPASATETAARLRQTVSTSLRANSARPVRRYTASDRVPPAARPQKPSTQGSTVAMLMSLMLRCCAIVR